MQCIHVYTWKAWWQSCIPIFKSWVREINLKYFSLSYAGQSIHFPCYIQWTIGLICDHTLIILPEEDYPNVIKTKVVQDSSFMNTITISFIMFLYFLTVWFSLWLEADKTRTSFGESRSREDSRYRGTWLCRCLRRLGSSKWSSFSLTERCFREQQGAGRAVQWRIHDDSSLTSLEHESLLYTHTLHRRIRPACCNKNF